MGRMKHEPPPLEPREFRSPEEIDAAVEKLQRRVRELEQLDVQSAVLKDTGADNVAQSNVRETIREVFGTNSPEFNEHANIRLWSGGLYMGMSSGEVIQKTERGRIHVIAVLNGLIARVNERRGDLAAGLAPAPSTYFDRLKFHPRIADVSRDLFMDGHPWDAVFNASKALVNYVKEKSGRHDLDGAALMTTVFSKNAPVLAFNDLSNPTELDEQ